MCANNKRWARYITENIATWQAFLENSPFDINIEQLVIVRGFIKTIAWDAFAWTQNTNTRTIEVIGGAPGYGSLGGYHAVAFMKETGPEHRSWPPQQSAQTVRGGSSVDLSPSTSAEGSRSGSQTLLVSPSQEHVSAEYSRNQMVFLSYYKIKRRAFFWLRLQAAAGYHELPPSPPGASGDGAVYVGTEIDGSEEVSHWVFELQCSSPS